MASCPPTTLFATRYTSIPTFDISVGGGGGGGGGEGDGEGGGGVVNTFGSSPLSPTRPWEQHIQEISRELEVICGSPRNKVRGRLSSLSPNQRPPLTRHQSMGCAPKTPPLASTACLFKDHALASTPTPTKPPILLRAESQERVQTDPFGLYQRSEPQQCYRLVVRHEETSSRLNQQLSLVCPLKSEEVPARGSSPTYCEHRHSDSYIIRRQNSSRSGVLYKVPLDQLKPEDLFVTLVDDRLLRVCAEDGGSDAVVLEEVSIPTEVPVQSLVLSVMDDKWLYVQERGSGTMVADFSGTSAKYVPVFRENEAASQIEVFLRIPAEFDPEEVMVKTVDDQVVVTGSKRNLTMTVEEDYPLETGQDSPLTAGHSCPPSAVHFVVIIPLPSGAESRTVSAFFTRPNHLMITSRLRPTRRRYSF